MRWRNEKHTKVFHDRQRKDDECTNNHDQVVSIQEPLSKRQTDTWNRMESVFIGKQKNRNKRWLIRWRFDGHEFQASSFIVITIGNWTLISKLVMIKILIDLFTIAN